MNSRRSFFKQLLVGAATFAILPPATTYERIWKPKLIVPGFNFNGQFQAFFKYYCRPLNHEYARIYFHQVNDIDLCLREA